MSREQCRELAARSSRDPDELIEWWEERAAIREHDGGQPRADAERDAFEDVKLAVETATPRRLGPRAVTPPASSDAIERAGKRG